ncbi:non-ribosomal peptide synthetase, partial [Dactylosporangium siamense]|uniref:non-ribosomal peptide synthetase n=1 Tax=Dactylosporangium siamense TaxID=685454 RepID=UPI0031EC1B4E
MQVTHRGLAHLVAGQRDVFGMSPGLSVLQFASFGFDASVSELAVTLACGGRLVMAAESQRTDLDALARLVRDAGVGLVTLPPSVLAVVDLPGLETVVSAGERLDPGLAGVWAARARLVNAYGPTEVTVCATAGVGDASIGVPIGSARVWVLDRSLSPVPVGVVGEVFVGGPGVARGYVGRPELTAERFVAGGSGGRLYRTGDVARWGSDGRLEFVGRADAQVKVRGFRIEPAEVEEALRSHPAVADAVVVADGDRLVAYVVGDVDGLAAYLGERLPQYMVPGVFVELTELPLTRNGKVDREALPAADAARAAEVFVAPVGPVQELLAGMWAELLGVDRVGATESFFALGGHSLLATQVVSRIRSAFEVELPVGALFDAPTVAGLAAVL